MLAIISVVAGAELQFHTVAPTDTFRVAYDPLYPEGHALDTIGHGRYSTLTDADYAEVARELDVEVAAIRAVVEIETGGVHEGFFEPGKPIVNFDLSVFRKFAARRKINLAKYAKSHAVVFAAPNARRYGSRHAAQWARLEAAMTIDSVAAIEGAFWGMFQIGGFNWKQCGTPTIGEFARLMCFSEREQLELFAQFLKSRNLVGYLKAHNWAAFARSYNGNSYKRHSYDQRLARAYAKYKKEQQQQEQQQEPLQ